MVGFHCVSQPFQLLCLTAIVVSACGQVRQAPPEPEKPKNVIIVLVDTLRADHMSLYGYHRETTPFIDHLAAGSVVFERARSQSSCTFPSVNSLMTSRYPGVFTKQEKGQLGIPEEYPAIAEILDNRRDSTQSRYREPDRPGDSEPIQSNGGFGRGFDTFC